MRDMTTEIVGEEVGIYRDVEDGEAEADCRDN